MIPMKKVTGWGFFFLTQWKIHDLAYMCLNAVNVIIGRPIILTYWEPIGNLVIL